MMKTTLCPLIYNDVDSTYYKSVLIQVFLLPQNWQISQQVHSGLVFEDSFVIREVNILHRDPGAGGAQGPEVAVTQFGNILGPD